MFLRALLAEFLGYEQQTLRPRSDLSAWDYKTLAQEAGADSSPQDRELWGLSALATQGSSTVSSEEAAFCLPVNSPSQERAEKTPLTAWVWQTCLSRLSVFGKDTIEEEQVNAKERKDNR